MKIQGRQSKNIEDKRVTPNDVSMGMNTTLDTQAAPKGNRPRYDNALNHIRSESFKQRLNASLPEIQDMLKKGGFK